MTDTRARWCRHHLHPEPTVDKCSLGHDPRGGESFGKGQPGGWFRLPCHDQRQDGCGEKRVCADFDPFTDDEVALQDAEREADLAIALENIVPTAPMIAEIKRAHRGTSVSGTRKCPRCGKTLAWSISGFNGHLSARCETDGCVAFMD